MSFLSLKNNGRSLRSCVSMLALGAVLFSAGCDLALNHDKIDRSLDANRQDYRDGLAPRDLEFENFSSEESGIPPLESYVAPVSENLRPMPLVSLTVNQEIPLKNVLHDLATQANYDVEIDPRIRGSIIFTARNRPLDMVIDRISEIAGLRYSFDEDILRVELDTPYTETYKIDYLSIVRTSSSSVSNSISVTSGDETEAESGSSFAISSESESDFWGALDENLTQILNSNAGLGFLKTEEDPTITVTEANPQAPVVAVQPIDESSVTGETPVPTPGQNTAEPPVVQPPNVTLQVSSVPTSNTSGIPGEDSNAVSFEPAFSINRQAGLISVYGNERMHNKVTAYLTDLEDSVTSQVLIEAKVLEVSLTDEYSTGINWSSLTGIGGDLQVGFSNGSTSARPVLTAGAAANNFFVDYTSSDITAIVDAISRFGSVKALASPRLTVLNNQPAVLNVAQNTVYFDIEIDRTEATATAPAQTDIESEIESVPEGILINVMPTINSDDNAVTMQVRPTVTRIVDFANDPAVAFLGVTGVENRVPELSVQEMDSILRMNSGEVAVLGGLLQDRATSTQEGVPVLGELPLLGNMFRAQGDNIQKTELVVFLKATILNNAKDSIHQTDREIYKTFANDRRPFKL